VTLGYLWNGDASPQGFNGRIDEVRIWGVARTVSQVKQSMNYSDPLEPQGLVAHYTFNAGVQPSEQTFLNVVTEDGLPEGYFVPPYRRDGWAISYGLALAAEYSVQSYTSSQPPVETKFELVAYNPTNSSITYYISSISPVLSTLMKNSQAMIVDTRSGQNVSTKSLPQLVFLVLEIYLICIPDGKGGCSNFGSYHDLNITYYAVAPSVPGSLTNIYFNPVNACFAEVDACGVCGGDNSTCQCVSYHGFDTQRMAYTLFVYTTEQMSPMIDLIISTLNSSSSLLPGKASLDEQIGNLYETSNMVYGCMEEYYCNLQALEKDIEAL